ncbi:hypothetical protein ACWT_5102 [Actinoplanes sp. SE50]|uniref:DUF3866 family protein n=1 Tax=unclassified Actinoplanes TaxID=2626549 RepID=UPI00023ED291|nr:MULTISPECIES: DUF3866 family protein [unclassified Actinoplanes]AEV86119.1 hypothetical protein ACPL_5232 [Actinoplanes sp. SE50/110]ATO84517.1 hypothetical protein ACWT_5102 [Actinoplanes sp. SE50]SLM01927.1 hypothetical protein ACSP50_5165 [Actinoplanes sp. SE50/110]
MVRWRSGTVSSVRRRWRGAIELDVLCDGGGVRALAYPELVGSPEPGDRVLLNVGALVMGLGTGGYALVVALPDRLPADPADDGTTRDAGHLVKARYTPLQPILLGVDEEASPHRAVLAAAESLEAMPVVTADLHSALPAILAGVRADRPDARVAYVMTDGGALPAWFSRTLDGLTGHLAGTVTTGQAFGGDLEASTVHTGLLAARHVLRADVTVVAQGPGNLGTGTTWGFSGVALGEAVNAIGVLGGRPVGSLRISDGDGRERHRGVSHHSLTAYGKVALIRADLPVPEGLPAALAASIAPLAERHRIVEVPTGGLDAALRASPVPLSTMGRGLDRDHAYFLAAAAAGRHAAALLGADQ